eukprot:CAMPEP_0181492286 /NCGR_PEP_ID=MMETSP1110-20121109/50599_1 /TAXON_ID=174948 /ORGANISM="Symbiodinium sp., Strain CCMP421" /LENGTH=30 /DNA_ID= /DNA_START= /DNA_END= /DNA_ORIENTATION=
MGPVAASSGPRPPPPPGPGAAPPGAKGLEP